MPIKKVFTGSVGAKITTKDCINAHPCPCCDSKSVKRVEKKTKSTILDFNGQLLPAHEKWSIRFFRCTNCLHDYSIIEKNNELWANGDNLSPIEEFEIFWKYMDNEFCLSAYIDEDVYKTVPYDDIRDGHIENFITYMKNAGLVLNNIMENEWDIRMSRADQEKHNIQTNKDFINYLVSVVEKVVPISEYEESEYTQELDNEKYLAFSLETNSFSPENVAACFIGRFQIPHEIHFLHLKNAYRNYRKVIVLIGSSNRSRDPKNPFTVEERISIFKEYMKNNFIPDDAIHFIGIPDFKSVTKWTNHVKNEVQKFHQGETILVGSYKDASSYYLDLFPQWKQDFTPIIKGFSSSYYREPYFENGEIHDELPEETQEFLLKFKDTRVYWDLCAFDKGNKNYQRGFKNLPFAVPFMTGDALVECNDCILVIRRSGECGDGQLALPGGFFESGLKYNPNTGLYDSAPGDTDSISSAIRELHEEARIEVGGVVLDEEYYRSIIRNSKVYCEPDRSLRWRISTTTTHFKLPYMESLPEVYINNEVKQATWIPIKDLPSYATEFFEDHYLMIDDMLGL